MRVPKMDIIYHMKSYQIPLPILPSLAQDHLSRFALGLVILYLFLYSPPSKNGKSLISFGSNYI